MLAVQRMRVVANWNRSNCRCRELCLSHILACYGRIHPPFDLARIMEIENGYAAGQRPLLQHLYVDIGSLLGVAFACEMPIASVQLWCPVNPRQGGFVLGWSDTRDAGELLNAILSGQAKHARTWHVQVNNGRSGSRIQWCAVGTAVDAVSRTFPFRALRRVSPKCRLTLTTMGTVMSLFCDARLISYVQLAPELTCK